MYVKRISILCKDDELHDTEEAYLVMKISLTQNGGKLWADMFPKKKQSAQIFSKKMSTIPTWGVQPAGCKPASSTRANLDPPLPLPLV